MLSTLQVENRRLVTLSGPGGVGKSRLAIEAIKHLDASWNDSVWFVSLASISDVQLVAAELATAFNVREGSGERLIQRVAAFLQGFRSLLVVDSFDRVIGAASILTELLGLCPQLTVMVTSRRKLGVSGELNLSIQPFSTAHGGAIAPASDLLQRDAVRLFLERASAASSTFEVTDDAVRAIAEICIRLDGLPLAIELAAAQTAVFTPLTVLARIERQLPMLIDGPPDTPDRQRTLDATIDWSYTLLSPSDQALLRHLSVFTGTISLVAAIEIVGHGPHAEREVVGGIARLLAASLLTQQVRENGDDRFSMLETVRQFSAQCLEASGERDRVSRRHAAYFSELAETAVPALYGGPEQQAWLDRLAIEHDNLRAALTWSISNDPERGLRIAGSLFWFWYLRGFLREGRAWLEALLAQTPTAPPAIRGRGLLGLGMIAQREGDDRRARVHLLDAAALLRPNDEHVDLALAIGLLGVLEEDRGAYSEAQILLEESLAILNTVTSGQQHPLAGLALAHLGVVAWGANDVAGAERSLEAAISIHSEAGDMWGGANASSYLGLLACHRRDAPRAAQLMRESLVCFRALGSPEEIANGLAGVATLAANAGQMVLSARLFGASGAIREQIGSHYRLPERTLYAAALDALQVTLGDGYESEMSIGRAMTIDGAVAAAIEFTTRLEDAANASAAGPRGDDLTTRERDVLRLLVDGLTDRDIATALFISTRTAQGHVARLFAKLDVNTRSAAVAVALRNGLIDPPVSSTPAE